MSKIYFDKKLPLIVVEAYIEAKSIRSMVMALDTGSSRTIIPYEAALAIGCDPTGSRQRTRIITGSGIEIAPVVSLKSIQVLGRTVRNLKVVCHNLPEEGYVDGLLGLDFLKKFRLVLDFKKGVIEIS